MPKTLLKNLVNKQNLIYSPYYIIFFLIFFGGGVIYLNEAIKIEFGQVLPWFALLVPYTLLKFKKDSNFKTNSLKLIHKFINSKNSRLAIYFIIFIIIQCFIAHSLKHLTFNTNGFDLSFIHQALFYPFEEPFFPANFSTSINGSALGEHLIFSTFLMLPITVLTKSDLLIFFIQSFLSFLAIYILLFKGPLGKSKTSILYGSFIILSYPSMRGALIWDFREEILAFLFMTLCIHFINTKKFIWYFVSLFLAICSKENICLITPFLGIPIFFDNRLNLKKYQKILIVSGTLLLSLLYFYVAFKIIMPHYSGDSAPTPFLVRFGNWGSTPSEIIFNILTSPKIWPEVISRIISIDKIKYILLLIFPILIMTRKVHNLLWLIPGLAGIGMNIITDYKQQISFGFHYELIIYPFLFFTILKTIESEEISINKKVVTLLIAIAFSGRWPGFYISKNIPTFSDIKAQLYVDDLKNELIADNVMSAQVNHLRKYIPLRKYSSFLNVVDEKKDILLNLKSNKSKMLYEFIIKNHNDKYKKIELETTPKIVHFIYSFQK